MKVLELAYKWYEDYSPVLFEPNEQAPDEAAWQSVCRRAVEAAALREIRPGNDHWIGWDTLVDEAAKVLEEWGFKRVDIVQASYWGSCIIEGTDEGDKGRLPDELLAAVIRHNQGVRERLHG